MVSPLILALDNSAKVEEDQKSALAVAVALDRLTDPWLNVTGNSFCHALSTTQNSGEKRRKYMGSLF